MLATLSALFVGLLRGMGHALEPDHLAAVSTIVAESRGTSRSGGLLLGAAWGAGHTITLVFVGGALFLLRAQMPPMAETALELVVSLMLIVLGARAIVRAVQEGRRGSAHAHAHLPMIAIASAPARRGEVREHAHVGPHDHVHVRGWTLARRPLVVGIMHGLAGSGALTAAVLAELPTTAAALLYMALFGIGSCAGMALLSGVAGVPLARLARSPRALPMLLGTSGTLSLGLGCARTIVHASKFF